MMTDVAPGEFDQKLDHADPASPTFKQRYWYSTQYVRGPNAVIYVICGERVQPERRDRPRGSSRRRSVRRSSRSSIATMAKSLAFADPAGVEDMKYLLDRRRAACGPRRVPRPSRRRSSACPASGSPPAARTGMFAAFYWRSAAPVVGAWASSARSTYVALLVGRRRDDGRALGPDCLKLHQQVILSAALCADDATRDAMLGRLGMLHYQSHESARRAPEADDQSRRASPHRWRAARRGAARQPPPVLLGARAGVGSGRWFRSLPDAAARPGRETCPAPVAPPAASARGGRHELLHDVELPDLHRGRLLRDPNPNREPRSCLRASTVAQVDDCQSFWHVTPNVDATRAEYFDAIKNVAGHESLRERHAGPVVGASVPRSGDGACGRRHGARRPALPRTRRTCRTHALKPRRLREAHNRSTDPR